MSWYRAPLWDLWLVTSYRNVAVLFLWVCNLHCSHSMVRVAQNPNHTLLPHLRLPQSGGPGSCIYIPQQHGAQLYPRTLGSLYVATYDSQGYGGGILIRLQIAFFITPLVQSSHECSVNYTDMEYYFRRKDPGFIRLSSYVFWKTALPPWLEPGVYILYFSILLHSLTLNIYSFVRQCNTFTSPTLSRHVSASHGHHQL
jgi:hypothetical protein